MARISRSGGLNSSRKRRGDGDMIKTIIGWTVCAAAWFAFGFMVMTTIMTY